MMKLTLSACVGAAVIAGCSGAGAVDQFTPAASEQMSRASSVHRATGTCAPFRSTFDAFVACQRADGTLQSFTNSQVAWRVRYFVRYQEMPCGEAPTVEEAYVFHAVTNDLEGDQDLSDTQRLAIRSAMYAGKVNCN